MTLSLPDRFTINMKYVSKNANVLHIFALQQARALQNHQLLFIYLISIISCLPFRRKTWCPKLSVLYFLYNGVKPIMPPTLSTIWLEELLKCKSLQYLATSVLERNLDFVRNRLGPAGSLQLLAPSIPSDIFNSYQRTPSASQPVSPTTPHLETFRLYILEVVK